MKLRPLLQRLMPGWSHDAVLFEVTPRCNLRCLHCYNVWKDGVGYSEAELDTAGAMRLLDIAVSQSRCRQLTLTGGEPLLREDLQQLVSHASGRVEQVALITNGTLLSADRVRALCDAGVTLFELPLNSADRLVHDQLAGGGTAAFDRTVAAAAEVVHQGADLAFVFVGTKENIEHWRDALELGIALGASTFLFNRYNAGGAFHDQPQQLMPSVEQVKAALAVAEHYAQRYGLGIGASIAVPPCLIDPAAYPHVGFGFCAAGTERAYYTIDPLGNVRPCNHSPTILGNLFDKPFKEIVRSDKLAAFTRARPDFCRGCRIEDSCLGGCKAAAQVCYGALTDCEPFLRLNLDRARKLD